MTAVLAAERVCLRHAGADRDSVRDVSLEVREGEILALVGPNGSGKSTLLASLAGLLAPRTGRVLLQGQDASRLSKRHYARQVASLAQDPAAPEGLTVESLVRSGRYPHRRFLASLGRDDHAAVDRALALLDVESLRARTLETLSGGERRRSWLAMVLAQQAPILLLDEPTAALDLRHQWEVIALLTRINRDHGSTLVVVLHDLAQAARVAHRVALLHRGRVYEVGAPESLLRREALRDVFGVDVRIAELDGDPIYQVRGAALPVRSL